MTTGNYMKMEYCRLCQDNVGKLSVNSDKELMKKITEVTKVNLEDELNAFLPTCVCLLCLNKIVDIYAYVKIVQKVDETLRNEIGTNESIPSIDNSDCVVKSEEGQMFDKCPATFLNQESIKSHVSSRKKVSTLFICSLCQETFKKSKNFHSHKKKHKELCCEMCEVVFDNIESRKTHECVETTKNNINKGGKRKSKRKSKPEIKLKTELKMLEPAALNTENNVYQCNTCNRQFSNKNSLRVHLKTHKNFICTQENCSQEFPTAYSLKIHNLRHLGKRPFLCVTCGKGFNTKNSLNCHEKIHSEIKGYKCTICNIAFSVNSNLRAHVKKYHLGFRFYCSQCPKEFLGKSSLERHEKIHLGIKEFKCEHCTSAFYTNKELVKHQRYHQGLKLHKCEECFKTFFERHHLIIHLRSHSGEKPYACKIPGCGKSFAESQKLKRHHTAKHNAVN